MSHLPDAPLIFDKNLRESYEKVPRRSLFAWRVEKELRIKGAVIPAEVMRNRRGVCADDMRNRDLENLDFIVQRLMC